MITWSKCPQIDWKFYAKFTTLSETKVNYEMLDSENFHINRFNWLIITGDNFF